MDTTEYTNNGYFCFKLNEDDVSASTIYVKFLDEVRVNSLELFNVVIDATGIDILYSNNISDIVKIKLMLNENDGHLYLINISEKLENLLTLNNLHKVINFYSTEEEFLFDIGISSNVNDETVLKSEFVVTNKDSTRVVFINGSLIGYEQDVEMKLFLRDAIKDGISTIELDLSKTIFIDSSAITMLINLIKDARLKGISIVTSNPNEIVKDLFEIVGFEYLLANIDNVG